jgi:hypothetical protein
MHLIIVTMIHFASCIFLTLLYINVRKYVAEIGKAKGKDAFIRDYLNKSNLK